MAALHTAGLALLLATSGTASGDTEAALDAGLASIPAGPARALWASAQLVGAPYVLSPLGEEAPPDADPRFRLDAFDCVTLVETAIALGNASSVAQARALLDDIRYDGPPGWTRRDHYVEAQWLPVNAAKGWIADATRSIAGAATSLAVLRHTRASWREARRSGRLLPQLDADSLPVGRFAVPFVPIGRAVELAPRIPAGTVLLVVRAARAGLPYRVTHMGIVVEGPDGARRVRHASDARGGMRVLDEPFERFVARHRRFQQWPVVGLSLWAIRDNEARSTALSRSPPPPAPR